MSTDELEDEFEEASREQIADENDNRHYTQFLISLISGVGGGLLTTIVCAPLDVVKIRLQVQGSLGLLKYSGGTSQVLRMIYREEGIRGVFKGLGPAMFTIPLFWGVYWPIYDRLKAHFQDKADGTGSHGSHMKCAIIAGAVSDVITNPFWVTRTRIQTLALHPEVHLASNISTFGMMKVIYQEEGFSAFYRGLGASFLGLGHVAIQFPLYEYLKKIARDRRVDGKETLLDLLASSIVAKLFASSITYPHEVLRARLQDGRIIKSDGKKVNVVTVFRDIVRTEGVVALWSGLRVNLLRIIPATCTSFVSYEYISRYLRDKDKRLK